MAKKKLVLVGVMKGGKGGRKVVRLVSLIK